MPKFTDLPVATTFGDADQFAAVQGGVSKSYTGDLILDAADARTANIFGEGYHQPFSFTNGFVQHPTTPLRAYVTGFQHKAIYLKGMLDCSLVTFTPGSLIQAFRLPSLFRPLVTMHFPVIGLYDAIGICVIQTDGYVYFKNIVGDLLDSGVIDLANVQYYNDPF